MYHFESKIVDGVFEHRHLKYNDLILKARVRVQSFPDSSLRIKIENPYFFWDKNEIKLTQEATHSLEEPFLVHVKRGLVKNVFVSSQEPNAITNIKKSLLSQLLLDTSRLDPMNENKIIWFMKKIKEESIHGKCKTTCEVVRMTPEEGNKLEELWEEEWRKTNATFSSEGKSSCDGKTYYKITKSIDLDNCEFTPSININVMPNEDQSEGSGFVFDSHSTNMIESKTFICGTLSSFNIRKVLVEHKADAENSVDLENVHKPIAMMTLIKKQSMKTTFPIPQKTRKENSLVYKYSEEDNNFGYNGISSNKDEIGGISLHKLIQKKSNIFRCPSNKVALKSHDGRYIVADRTGSANANGIGIGAWTTFTAEEVGQNRVTLKSIRGKYFVAEPSGGGRWEINANRGSVGPWEVFTIIPQRNGAIAMKTVHDRFVVAQTDGTLKGDGINIEPLGLFMPECPFGPPSAELYRKAKKRLRQILVGRMIPQAVRLAFHDCVGPNGCDGCLNQNIQVNKGILPVFNLLVNERQTNFKDLSHADFWQIAGIAALENANNKLTTNEEFKITFKGGRLDCPTSPFETARHTFPSPAMNRTAMMNWFSSYEFGFGMNEKQVTALMGAHSLGEAKRENSGYNGSWTPNRENVFDNEFYQGLSDKVFGAHLFKNKKNPNRLIGDKRFQWDLSVPSNFTKSKLEETFMMLNTDIELVFDIDVDNKGSGTTCELWNTNSARPEGSCPIADSKVLVDEYALNEEKFLRDFKEAYEIMMTAKIPYTLVEPKEDKPEPDETKRFPSSKANNIGASNNGLVDNGIADPETTTVHGCTCISKCGTSIAGGNSSMLYQYDWCKTKDKCGDFSFFGFYYWDKCKYLSSEIP